MGRRPRSVGLGVEAAVPPRAWPQGQSPRDSWGPQVVRSNVLLAEVWDPFPGSQPVTTFRCITAAMAQGGSCLSPWAADCVQWEI